MRSVQDGRRSLRGQACGRRVSRRAGHRGKPPRTDPGGRGSPAPGRERVLAAAGFAGVSGRKSPARLASCNPPGLVVAGEVRTALVPLVVSTAPTCTHFPCLVVFLILRLQIIFINNNKQA